MVKIGGVIFLIINVLHLNCNNHEKKCKKNRSLQAICSGNS